MELPNPPPPTHTHTPPCQRQRDWPHTNDVQIDETLLFWTLNTEGIPRPQMCLAQTRCRSCIIIDLDIEFRRSIQTLLTYISPYKGSSGETHQSGGSERTFSIQGRDNKVFSMLISSVCMDKMLLFWTLNTEGLVYPDPPHSCFTQTGLFRWNASARRFSAHFCIHFPEQWSFIHAVVIWVHGYNFIVSDNTYRRSIQTRLT